MGDATPGASAGAFRPPAPLPLRPLLARRFSGLPYPERPLSSPPAQSHPVVPLSMPLCLTQPMGGNEENEERTRDWNATEEANAPRSAKASKKKKITRVPSKNWTVKRGKCEAPLDDDYKLWNLEQLRRECTARGKVIERGADDERDQRESFLEESDNDRLMLISQIDPEMALPPSKRAKQSDNIRMRNVLFSDLLAEAFARTEDQKTRTQIDVGEPHDLPSFWYTVAEEDANNETDYNGLYVDDPQYAGIDPSQRTAHDAATLRKMWKNLVGLYRAAYRRSTASGSHGPFIDYSEGRLDVAYVDVCVGEKQILAGFARGGMPEETRMDSHELGSMQPPRSKRRRVQAVTPTKSADTDELKDALRAVTTYFTRKDTQPAPAPMQEPTPNARTPLALLECISTSYKIVTEMREMQSRLEAKGQPTSMVRSSIAIQERAIVKLEQELTELMGLGTGNTDMGSDLDISF